MTNPSSERLRPSESHLQVVAALSQSRDLYVGATIKVKAAFACVTGAQRCAVAQRILKPQRPTKCSACSLEIHHGRNRGERTALAVKGRLQLCMADGHSEAAAHRQPIGQSHGQGWE